MMSNTTAILDAQKNLEEIILKKMEDFETQLNASHCHSPTVEQLSKEFTDFKSHVLGVLKLLQQQISEITYNVDVMEMRHRRKFLLISGIPEKPDEDLPLLITGVLSKQLDASFSGVSISAAYRLGKQNNNKARPIIFRFTDQTMRYLAWRKKNGFKGSPYVISEFLTKYRQGLFTEARKMFDMRSVWTADGAIYVKLPDSTRHKIHTHYDLKKLIQQHNRSKVEHAHTGTATSVDKEGIGTEVDTLETARPRRLKRK